MKIDIVGLSPTRWVQDSMIFRMVTDNFSLEINMSPEIWDHFKRKLVFQPAFSGHLFVFGGVPPSI